MLNWLFWLMLVFAALDWAASWMHWSVVRWVTKPGTLLLLIAWFTQAGGWRGALLYFGLGLVFSLVGDLMLQHTRKTFFIPGMLAFFLAHLFYILGFAHGALVVNWLLIVPALGIPVVYVLYLRYLRKGLAEHNEMGMFAPVTAYAFIISQMLFFAVSTLFRPSWSALAAALAVAGGLLFYLSDAVLAQNRFVTPHRASDLVVMVTYHLGQMLITASALTQFAGS